jgi:hypothetical protein
LQAAQGDSERDRSLELAGHIGKRTGHVYHTRNVLQRSGQFVAIMEANDANWQSEPLSQRGQGALVPAGEDKITAL